MAVLRSYLKLGGMRQPLTAGQESQQNRLCDRLMWGWEAVLSYARTTGSFIRGRSLICLGLWSQLRPWLTVD